jgi:bacterioferritin-associated ferredoxin
MDVCHCHGVSERDIDHAVDRGARTLFDVMGCLGAGTGCGNCQNDVRRAIDRALVVRAPDAQNAGCSSTSRMTPTRISVGTSLNTLK